MTTSQQRQYDRFGRTLEFLDKHSNDFASGSRVIALRDELKTVTANLKESNETGAPKKSGPRAYSSAKLDALNALRADIVKIARTATAITRVEPNFKNTFQVPDKRRKDDLVTAAKQFKKDANKSKNLFTGWEMQDDFLDQLQARIDGYEAAQKGEARVTSSKKAAPDEQSALLENGVQVLDSLEILVENKYHGNEAVLNEWAEAIKIDRPTRRRNKKEKVA